MGVARKVISIVVRPLQASNLCFEIDGILEELNEKCRLGSSVPVFNFAELYEELRSFQTEEIHTHTVGVNPQGQVVTQSEGSGKDPSRLHFNSKNLLDRVQPYSLATFQRKNNRSKSLIKKGAEAQETARTDILCAGCAAGGPSQGSIGGCIAV